MGRVVKMAMRTGWQGCFWSLVHHQKGLSYTSHHNHDPTGVHLAPPRDGLPGGVGGGKNGEARQCEGGLAGVLLGEWAPPKRPA